MRRDNPLLEFLDEVAVGPDPDLLELDLETLCSFDQTLSAQNAQRLKELFAAHAADHLGRLRDGLRYSGPSRLLPADLRLLAMDLGKALHAARVAGTADPTSLPSPSRLRHADELQQWARAKQISSRLSDSVPALSSLANSGHHWMLAQLVERLAPELQIAEVHCASAGSPWLAAAQQQLPKAVRLAPEHAVGGLRQLTSNYLRRAASLRRAFQNRRAAVQRWVDAPPAGSEHHALFLSHVERTLARAMADLEPTSFEPELVEFVDQHGASAASTIAGTVGTRREDGTSAQHSVQLELSEWQSTAIDGMCNCGAAGCCAHLIVLLDWTTEILLDPRSLLSEWARVPSWTRLLAALDQSVSDREAARARADGERLAWQLHAKALRLLPLVQTRNKKGTYSKGKRTQPRALLRSDLAKTLQEGEREVLDLLDRNAGYDNGYYPTNVLCRALRNLIGHPRLFLAGDTRRCSVEDVTLRLSLQRVEGGYQIQPVLGDVPLPAAALRRSAMDTNCIVHVQPETFRVLLCELDAAAVTFVSQMAVSGSFLPEHAVGELARRLPQLQDQLDLELPRELLGRRVTADTRLHVVLEERVAGSLDATVCVRPVADGPLLPPGRGVSRLVTAVGTRRVHVLRDLAEERRRVLELFGRPALASTKSIDSSCRRAEGIGEIVALLACLRDEQDVVVSWIGAPFELASRIDAGSLKLSVKQKRGLLWLGGDAEVEGENVRLALLLDAARRGQPWIQLGPRKFALLEARLVESLGGTLDLVRTSKAGLELPAAFAPRFDELFAQVSIEDDGGLAAAVERARSAATLEPEVPAGLTAELRPYQVEGLKWLCRMAAWRMGACLADDMGLGKTLQCLGLLLHREKDGPALVVAPTSLAGNWSSEAAKFAPSLNLIAYRGGRRAAVLKKLRPGDVLVTSYEIVTRDIAELASVEFSTLVLDEAQALKNAKSQRSKAMQQLRARVRVALSGTPVENHLGELWSLFRVLEPGLFGTWSDFAERFAKPIEGMGDQSRMKALRRVLAPFILRRTKSEVLPDLPPRIDVVRRIALSSGERELYEQARVAALARVTAGGPEGRIELLSALTRLRRLVCHPRLYDEQTTAESSKLQALLELLDELTQEQRRALVFSQFTSFLELVRAQLDLAGISSQYLDGSTPAAERAQRVAAFQNGESDVFLISLKAGGTGLNLTAADTAILLDPWWNPAAEDQASSRAHRIGQTVPVTVVRLIAERTIEERVLQMHAEKRALAEQMLDGSDANARLSNDELLDLLAASAASGD
jgi:superfamily II DNA or RNA helicase